MNNLSCISEKFLLQLTNNREKIREGQKKASGKSQIKEKAGLLSYLSYLSLDQTEADVHEMFLGEDVLKRCSKPTGEHKCRSLISRKMLTTLLKLYFHMGVLLQICCIFSEQLFLTLMCMCMCTIVDHDKFDKKSIMHFLVTIILCVILLKEVC